MLGKRIENYFLYVEKFLSVAKISLSIHIIYFSAWDKILWPDRKFYVLDKKYFVWADGPGNRIPHTLRYPLTLHSPFQSILSTLKTFLFHVCTKFNHTIQPSLWSHLTPSLSKLLFTWSMLKIFVFHARTYSVIVFSLVCEILWKFYVGKSFRYWSTLQNFVFHACTKSNHIIQLSLRTSRISFSKKSWNIRMHSKPFISYKHRIQFKFSIQLCLVEPLTHILSLRTVLLSADSQNLCFNSCKAFYIQLSPN